MAFSNTDPVVVGGLGGSGTRAVAAILRNAGVYIGDCLNEPLDNLWFTLLFRRPKRVLNFHQEALLPHLDIFEKRMQGNCKWNNAERIILCKCAWEFAVNNYVRNDRFGFPYNVYKSFFKKYVLPAEIHWGWKEPNSHLFLSLLATRYPDLKFIHVMRHPLDLVFGKNQLQLHNWKHLFNISERDERKAMLLFYVAANERVLETGKRLGGNRFLVVRHEELCAQPKLTVDAMLSFCGLNVPDSLRGTLYRIPTPHKISTDYAKHNYDALQPLASDVASRFGYSV